MEVTNLTGLTVRLPELSSRQIERRILLLRDTSPRNSPGYPRAGIRGGRYRLLLHALQKERKIWLNFLNKPLLFDLPLFEN